MNKGMTERIENIRERERERRKDGFRQGEMRRRVGNRDEERIRRSRQIGVLTNRNWMEKAAID